MTNPTKTPQPAAPLPLTAAPFLTLILEVRFLLSRVCVCVCGGVGKLTSLSQFFNKNKTKQKKPWKVCTALTFRRLGLTQSRWIFTESFILRFSSEPNSEPRFKSMTANPTEICQKPTVSKSLLLQGTSPPSYY